MMYPLGDDSAKSVPASPSFPEIETGILDFWKTDDTFAASIDQREGAPEWVFYDGPPFANGLPHYGHLLTGYAKDLFPRYQTMRGKQVHRRFGWDTHGLPAELEAMKQLGITEKDQIEEMGIGAFNQKARESVLRYTREWQDYVTRQARWVDFENDYKTLNVEFMESVLWAFKQLWDKGLAYEGFRVLPYCWRDETPLSNHELRMDDDVYQERDDPAVTVGYRMANGDVALIWTTTPWTLPANLAIMVGEDIDYVTVESDVPTGRTERYVIAEARAQAYARELTGSKDGDVSALIVERRKGSHLVGLEYTPPFSYYLGHEGAFRVLSADFVTTTDGTGLVHTAAAFGEDDMRVTDANGIRPVMPVDEAGLFRAPVTEYAGLQVFDANRPIIADLKRATAGEEAGAVSPGTILLRQESYRHSYPHCWRCRNPLIYKAVSSWFVRVTELKDRLLENNESIEWVPGNVKHGQFGKWLEGARDWSISRNRFWGSPIPVWQSDNPEFPRTDVYGSLAEIERDFGRLPRNEAGEVDLHRPYIDDLTRPNPDDPSGESTMRRIEDVFDVWFDSGSMQFAQVHYPFENREWFDTHAPADFIVEYIGQTRGWFYVMHVLSTALFDRPAFRSVVSHGIVLGNDGQKMSKSLRNYPDVSEVFDRDGSDAMRWFLMSSPILRGGNLIVTEEGIREGVRQFLLPLWSTWYFFTIYANSALQNDANGYRAERRTDSTDVLDRYILAKLRELVEGVTADLDALDGSSATLRVRDFADVLTNWYVRRSRDRFWRGADTADGRAAFDTLYTVLETLTRVAAPLAPLVTEEVWRGLTGGRSVHLTDWPDAAELPADDGLVQTMDAVRQISSSALALRKKAGRRVRQPLSTLTVVAPGAASLGDFADIVRDELNVKSVVFEELSDASAAEHGISSRLSVNARAAGPRLGKQVQQVIKAAREGNWSENDGQVVAGGIALQEGEYDLALEISGESQDTQIALLQGGGFLLLDTEVTPELAAEGLARDLIRTVQDARKAAGFEVSDRIALAARLPKSVHADLEPHRELVQAETLALELALVELEGEGDAKIGDGVPVSVHVEKRSGEK